VVVVQDRGQVGLGEPGVDGDTAWRTDEEGRRKLTAEGLYGRRKS
jgi:hypothetical protein